MRANYSQLEPCNNIPIPIKPDQTKKQLHLYVKICQSIHLYAIQATRGLKGMQKITAGIVVRLLLLAAIASALNGCGTKGPLYIPEQQYPQNLH